MDSAAVVGCWWSRTRVLVAVLILSGLSFQLRHAIHIAQQATYEPQHVLLDKDLIPTIQRNHSASANEDEWMRRDRMIHRWIDECFYVEDLCFHSNRFFYRTDHTKDLHQPRFDLELFPTGSSGPAGYSSKYGLSHSSTQQTQALAIGCVDAKARNHVIMHCQFNDMLGEFYANSVVGLYAYLRVLNIDIVDFVQNAELYIHRMRINKPLMNSHHTFTKAFRSSALIDLLQLLDSPQCQCLPRVYFCGYIVEKPSSPPLQGSNKTVHLKGGGYFSLLKTLTYPIYASARRFMRRQLILNNPYVVDAIQTFRQEVLPRNRTLPVETENWKLIGLTQRSGRRRWQDLSHIVDVLNERLQDQQILLVEVNVEGDDWTPDQHLIRHAGLDGLIGIHGAQLTEAVWMKTGALVVELLPYIPTEARHGDWTALTTQATPLGIIFAETDLVHVGYKLERDSAPYCHRNETGACWNFYAHRWDTRDFGMSAKEVYDIIDMFIINKPTTCAAYQNLSTPSKRVVVYNAPCNRTQPPLTDEPAPGEEIGHFYWNETSAS